MLVPRYVLLDLLSMCGWSMGPHPENGLARASDSLNAHLGQEQRLTLQGAKGAPGKLPTAWNCRRPTAAAFARVSSAMGLLVACGHCKVAYRIMGGYRDALAAGVAPRATAGPADTTPARAYRGHST